MPLKLCTGCGQLRPKEVMQRGRCPTCAGLHEQERGTRQERGAGGTDYDSFARWIKENRPSCLCTGECGAGRCVQLGYCGHPFGDPNNPITVGHIVPRVRGGSNERSNLRPECRSCNLRKGGR